MLVMLALAAVSTLWVRHKVTAAAAELRQQAEPVGRTCFLCGRKLDERGDCRACMADGWR